jgi:hypothetical protein
MAEAKTNLPLKIGLVTVVAAYFLFTFHAMFTLSWIGEWENLGGGGYGQVIFVEDINATVGLVFRFAASIIALAAVIYYLTKGISKSSAYKILKVVLVFEGIYWLGLISTAFYSVLSLNGGFGFGHPTLTSVLTSLATNVIPDFMESLVLPIVLFILAYKLSPNKPFKVQIKWALISGTILILVFWLINISMWLAAAHQKGWGYITSYPFNLFSFLFTVFGLLALAIYTAVTAKRYAKIETPEQLNLKPAGLIITVLGIWFLWNYLSWIFFGGDYVWSDWFAWFLGHNMDLWMLALPLVGVPLLFNGKQPKNLLLATEGIGAVFTGIFLAAYLAGLPTTNVLHSELAFRIPLAIFGLLMIVLVIACIIAAKLRKE